MIAADIPIVAQFYDLDPMQVVWHGNYLRYFEQARGALLDKLGYNYPEMEKSGYIWPVVDVRVKYTRPVRYMQRLRVEARLVEYENRLKIAYVCRDELSGETLTKGETIQVAVKIGTQELCFESPSTFVERVREALCAQA